MGLASGGVLGTYTPIHLFAGEAPVITGAETVASGQGVLAQHRVVGRITASGLLAAHNPGADDGSQVAIGILTQGVDATSANQNVAIYKGGYFNHAALVWHANTDTLVERKQAFDGTPIFIGTVSGS
jgi:hypothetical protein